MAARLGDYEIIGEIARGGSGAVFRGFDPRLGRRVAIKVLIPLAGPRGKTRRQRFEREAQTLCHLEHPNIVPVLDAGEQGDCPWIVMELVEGESLEERLEATGGLRPGVAASLILPLADALQHAHEAGVLHRDIKPSNVLITRTGVPKLTDFGLARFEADEALTALTQAGTAMGTPGYWPPEQAGGELERVGPRSDVYSLGATLYAALTGRPPFEGDSMVQNLVATMNEPPLPPSRANPAVDPVLEAICLRCLAKAPEERYDSAGTLADALRAYLAGEPLEPRRSGLPTLPVVAGAGLLLVALLVGAASYFSVDSAPSLPAAPPLPGSRTPPPGTDPLPADPPRPQGLARYEAPETLSGLIERGEGLLERKPSAALAAFDRALVLLPNDPRALAGRGQARRKLGELQGALEDFELALQLEPRRASHWSNRGIVRLALGDPDGALADQNRSLEISPHPTAYLNRGVIRCRLGNLEGGIADFDRSIELDPTDAMAWTNRGTARERLGDLKEALRDHTRALELDPSDAQAWFNRSAVRYLQKDIRGAFADLEDGLRACPEDPKLLGAVAALHLTQDDLPTARRWYLRALEAQPGQAIPHYNLACIALRQGDLNEGKHQLGLAVDCGYRDREHLETDPDLDPLRGTPWFEALLTRARAADRR